jgi:HTH-type transcriptional regulator / antitoxin HipB
MEYPILSTAQLALHLRSLRKTRNLTQAALGQKIGVNQARIGKIERDPSGVRVEQLMQIIALLGVRLVLKEAIPKKDGQPPSPDTSQW